MVRKSTQRGRGREPEAEEFDFIFGRLHRSLSITEIKIDLAGQKFIPLRGDSFYYRLRREFDAAKKVISSQQQATLNHLGVEARKEHFDDLLNVVVKWDNELGNDVNGQFVSWESLVPSTFSAKDRELGNHCRGSIGWQVTEVQNAKTTEPTKQKASEVQGQEGAGDQPGEVTEVRQGKGRRSVDVRDPGDRDEERTLRPVEEAVWSPQ